MTVEWTTKRRAGRRVAVGSVICDFCEVRWPAFGLATHDDLAAEMAGWNRMQAANRDMCPDCLDLVWVEALARKQHRPCTHPWRSYPYLCRISSMKRWTKTKTRMIEVLYEAAPDALYGLEISRLAGIPSGSLYPALRDLRKAELVETQWRTPDDDPDGQPLRFYTLSPNGFALAKALAEGNVQGVGWKKFLPSRVGGHAVTDKRDDVQRRIDEANAAKLAREMREREQARIRDQNRTAVNKPWWKR